MKIRKVGIICKKDSAAALGMSRELLPWLSERGIGAVVDTIADDMDLLIINKKFVTKSIRLSIARPF